MSVLVELNIEYNRFFSKAVIALTKEDYITARSYLERAAKALNEIAVRRTGENKDYTQDWVFDIVKEIGDLDRRIASERSKEKVMKMLTEKGKEIGRIIEEKIGKILQQSSNGLTSEELAVFYHGLSVIGQNLQMLCDNYEE